MRFKRRDVSGERGSLQRIVGLLPTGARDDSKKGVAICDVTSWGADYVKT
jgi:hypothetical protein